MTEARAKGAIKGCHQNSITNVNLRDLVTSLLSLLVKKQRSGNLTM